MPIYKFSVLVVKMTNCVYVYVVCITKNSIYNDDYESSNHNLTSKIILYDWIYILISLARSIYATYSETWTIQLLLLYYMYDYR